MKPFKIESFVPLIAPTAVADPDSDAMKLWWFAPGHTELVLDIISPAAGDTCCRPVTPLPGLIPPCLGAGESPANVDCEFLSSGEREADERGNWPLGLSLRRSLSP